MINNVSSNTVKPSGSFFTRPKKDLESRIEEELSKIPEDKVQQRITREFQIRRHDILKKTGKMRKFFKLGGAVIGAVGLAATGIAGSVVGGIAGAVAGYNAGYTIGSANFNIDYYPGGGGKAVDKMIKGFLVGLGAAAAGGFLGAVYHGPVGSAVTGAAGGYTVGKFAHRTNQKRLIDNMREQVKQKHNG